MRNQGATGYRVRWHCKHGMLSKSDHDHLAEIEIDGQTRFISQSAYEQAKGNESGYSTTGLVRGISSTRPF